MNNKNWIIKISLITFVLSLVFNGISNVMIEEMNIIIAVLVLILMIGMGIFFDMIGMAVATCDEAPFHAKGAKKIKGAKETVKLIRAKEKVSGICNDVVGDVFGIVSGTISALLAVKVSMVLANINVLYISLVIGAIVASFTVGGKAIGKKIAIDKCVNIMGFVGRLVHMVSVGDKNVIEIENKRKNKKNK